MSREESRNGKDSVATQEWRAKTNLRIDGNQYICFKLLGDTGKTQSWAVMNKSSHRAIGHISWYGGWRQYTFQPYRNTEYNNACLDAISVFLTKLNSYKRILSVGEVKRIEEV